MHQNTNSSNHGITLRIDYDIIVILLLVVRCTIMLARGLYSGRKKERGKNILRSRGHDRKTQQQQRSDLLTHTAERSTTVTPTKRSTHPPCITGVQKMSCTEVIEVSRER